MPMRTGISIRGLLTAQWGLTQDYIESDISTIFVDGKPVDDLDSAIVKDGATLALSCAMPGLAGATMRRGGAIAGLRSGITHREAPSSREQKQGMITVKLFNMLIAELSPLFLAKGILIERKRLPAALEDLYPVSGTTPTLRLVAR